MEATEGCVNDTAASFDRFVAYGKRNVGIGQLIGNKDLDNADKGEMRSVLVGLYFLVVKAPRGLRKVTPLIFCCSKDDVMIL